MWVKRNITIKMACIITECLLSLIPMIVMIYAFFLPNEFNNIFSTLFIVPYFILVINTVLLLISLIAQIFIKTKYHLCDDALIIQAKSYTREIKYSQVAAMTYDLGTLTRWNPKPSELVLFDKNFKQLLSITNPSIIMVALLKKKCKNTKISYFHTKRFLSLLAIINGAFLLVSLLIILFG